MTSQEAQAQPAWSCADDESLALILSLLHEDAHQMKSNSKGKQVAGTLTDADLALQLHQEELGRVTTYVSDRRMTKSIQNAIRADTAALLTSKQEEDVAQNDRALAVALSKGRSLAPTQTPAKVDPSAAELEWLEKLSAIYITGIDGEEEEEEEGDHGLFHSDTDTTSVVTPESSSWAASRASKTSKLRPCMACGDMKHFVYLARAPCQHEYCRECLESLFRHAMLDEALFPPRCCRQDIPLDANRLFLSGDLVQQFKKKAIEFSTPNRLYCHQPNCSAFIPPSMFKDGMAQCPDCKATTCITCKKATHQGDCPADEALQAVLQMANEQGWQRCPKCSTMIELHTGCFHMT